MDHVHVVPPGYPPDYKGPGSDHFRREEARLSNMFRRGQMSRRRFTQRSYSRYPARRGGYRSHRQAVPYRSRKRFAKATKAIIRQPSGLPDRIFVKLRYRESLTFSQTSGSIGYNIYRGNSLFDPDLTGTGGQPYLYDQWSAFYNNYRVYGSKVRFDISGNGGGGFNGARFGLTPSTQSTVLSSVELYHETPRTKYRSMKMGAVAVGQGSVVHYISTRKAVGLNNKAEFDNDFSATVGANPAQQWYWHVWCYTSDQNTIAANGNVILTYYVEFYNRAVPGIS